MLRNKEWRLVWACLLLIALTPCAFGQNIVKTIGDEICLCISGELDSADTIPKSERVCMNEAMKRHEAEAREQFFAHPEDPNHPENVESKKSFFKLLSRELVFECDTLFRAMNKKRMTLPTPSDVERKKLRAKIDSTTVHLRILDRVELYKSRAFSYLELGAFDTARVDFEKVLDFDKDDVDAHTALGIIEEHAGNYKLALKHYEQAIEERYGPALFMSSLVAEKKLDMQNGKQ